VSEGYEGELHFRYLGKLINIELANKDLSFVATIGFKKEELKSKPDKSRGIGRNNAGNIAVCNLPGLFPFL
jgi:hypothetical protein